MKNLLNPLASLAQLTDAQTRSISAENPTGEKSGGAQASPGDDEHCTDAARKLGKGWKVRPCLRNIQPGQSVTLADIAGPGTIQHIWCTVDVRFAQSITLRAFYDDQDHPSILAPLGSFFANGLDGLAQISSIPVAVNPRGGMNCYWPMPFRKRMRIEITNDRPQTIPEFFFQITYAIGNVPDDVGYLHASYRCAQTDRVDPQHVILDGVSGRGHYVGTYLVWTQHDPGWWGEGEVKFFIDGDPPDAPTICGTGTEDYFGGAWGFTGADPDDPTPVPYTGPFLGHPQAATKLRKDDGPETLQHALYRWHIPDPIRFTKDLRVTIQALGWQDDGTYLPLADDIASVAYWYQAESSNPS